MSDTDLYQGRARRSEFWGLAVFFIILAYFAGSITKNIGVPAPISFAITLAIFLLPSPVRAVQIRRLHDLGLPGYLLFLWLIPLVLMCWNATVGSDIEKGQDLSKLTNGIICALFYIHFIVLGCVDGRAGKNQYGDNPKGVEKRISFLNRVLKFKSSEDGHLFGCLIALVSFIIAGFVGDYCFGWIGSVGFPAIFLGMPILAAHAENRWLARLIIAVWIIFIVGNIVYFYTSVDSEWMAQKRERIDEIRSPFP